MDVPSWHPANQNADVARRLAMSGGGLTQRTEFKEVATSTEAERQMVAKEESAVLGGGRGLLDPSDRLYLVEQIQLEHQAKSREQMECHAALQTFRSNALKVQAQKTSAPEIPVVTGKKSLLTPEKKAVVVIKAKKRKTTTAEMETKAKKTKKSQTMSGSRARNQVDCRINSSTKAIKTQKKKSDAPTPPAKFPATALLVEDYSSDDG